MQSHSRALSWTQIGPTAEYNLYPMQPHSKAQSRRKDGVVECAAEATPDAAAPEGAVHDEEGAVGCAIDDTPDAVALEGADTDESSTR